MMDIYDVFSGISVELVDALELFLAAAVVMAIAVLLLMIMAIVVETELLLKPMEKFLDARDWIGDTMERPFGAIIAPLVLWAISLVSTSLITIVLYSGFMITILNCIEISFYIATVVNLVVWSGYWVWVSYLAAIGFDSLGVCKLNLEQMNANFATKNGLRSAGKSIYIGDDPLFDDPLF